MNTYEEGYELAVSDTHRFGILLAMDKLTLLEGEFADGYDAGIAGAWNLTGASR